jgi:LPXTG-site transpeptidase (sortase) family protein
MSVSVFTDSGDTPSITDDGRRVTFNFGTVQNTGATDETITLRYRVVVLDSSNNLRNLSRVNHVHWSWTSGDLDAVAPQVTILEPTLALTKDVNPSVGKNGDVVTFTIVLSHAAISQQDAFDVDWFDTLPVGLTYVPGTLQFSGQIPDSYSFATPNFNAHWANFSRAGDDVTITYTARINLGPGDKASNSTRVAWSSLPGDVSAAQSAYNTQSTERFYDPLSNINTYGVGASAVVRTPQLPETGFAPGKITKLPIQSVEAQYKDLGNLWLEIPKLNLKLPIIGVPLSDKGWDLTWLGNSAGWLNGTAYPTWKGNTGITAHVYDANGLPGPFVNLHTLAWGNEVIIHSNGMQYVYTVQDVYRANPADTRVLRHMDQPTLTLITCLGFDQSSNSYTWREVVRATLTKVVEEPITQGNP